MATGGEAPVEFVAKRCKVKIESYQLVNAVRPEFDRSQVASRSGDRAVEPGASSEHYRSHGQGVVPTTVQRSDVLSQGGYVTMPKTTAEARQMDSVREESRPVGLPSGPVAPVPVPWR